MHEDLRCLYVGLGIGRFERILAFLAARPEPIGFGVFQHAILSENTKNTGYSGRTRRVALAGWSGEANIFRCHHFSLFQIERIQISFCNF